MRAAVNTRLCAMAYLNLLKRVDIDRFSTEKFLIEVPKFSNVADWTGIHNEISEQSCHLIASTSRFS